MKNSTEKGDKKELFYDTLANSWDEVMNRYDLQRRLETFFSVFLDDYPLAGKELLDAGCGTGEFSKRAIEIGARVTSLDIGENLIARVKKEINDNAVIGSVLDLPFEAAHFDVVISSEVIEHTPNPEQAVSEFARVLKPGGILLLSCPNVFWYWSCWLANMTRIRKYEGLENWPGWWQMRRWLKQVGLEIEEMRGIHLFPFVVSWTQPLLKKLDALGSAIGPIFVNMALKAKKLPADT